MLFLAEIEPMNHDQTEAVEEHDTWQQKGIGVFRDAPDYQMGHDAGDQRHGTIQREPIADPSTPSPLDGAFGRYDDDDGKYE
jgi:hypothetical protein